jgi:hypothetical protein
MVLHPALVVEDSKGVVLLDAVEIHGDELASAVLLSNARAVGLQRGAITGSPGLALERGSRASASGVRIDSVRSSGRSLLETRGMDIDFQAEPGSRCLDRPLAPALVLSDGEAEIDLDAFGPSAVWLLAAPVLGFSPGGPRTEGVLLLDRFACAPGAGRVLSGGRASWTIASEPGKTHVQVLVLDLLRGRLVFSDVLRVGPER